MSSKRADTTPHHTTRSHDDAAVELALVRVARLRRRLLLRHLLLDVHGHGLVAGELHGVVGATLGHAAELGDVVEHLGERHESLDRLEAAGLVAELANLAAAGVEVTDDITHGILGSHDVHLHDGLEELGRALGDALAEGAARGNLERHHGRIDVVVLAVEERRLDVDDGETGDDTGAHHVLEALLDAGDVLLGHGTALEVGLELETGAGLEGLELDGHLGVLAGTAGLLLVGVGGAGVLGDGLAVVHLGRADVRLDLELALEAVDDDVEVELAHALDHGLVGLLIPAVTEGWVFASKLRQSFNHLVRV
mmetsp:Transcript_130755/g.317607  ORF Transcript_130755/g.317607 Transcript_130755/m.317607 type:complete len:309 (-) Transcript_130755:1217-2143(-)